MVLLLVSVSVVVVVLVAVVAVVVVAVTFAARLNTANWIHNNKSSNKMKSVRVFVISILPS